MLRGIVQCQTAQGIPQGGVVVLAEKDTAGGGHALVVAGHFGMLAVGGQQMCVALTAGQRLAVDLVRVASFRCGTIFNVPLGAPSPGVVKIVVQMVGVLGLRLFFVFAAVKTILDVLAVLAEGAVALFVLGMQTSLALIADAILIAVYVIFRRRLAAVTLTGVGAIAVVFHISFCILTIFNDSCSGITVTIFDGYCVSTVTVVFNFSFCIFNRSLFCC